MIAYSLDTSGAILDGFYRYRWSDLDPFTQGYVEALFATVGYPYRKGPVVRTGERPRRFTDLAPETLAAILKDCADGAGQSAETGRRFWTMRQARRLIFKPLTAYVGEDGKVRLRPAEHDASVLKAELSDSALATDDPIQNPTPSEDGRP